jgi:hypothetical protein
MTLHDQPVNITLWGIDESRANLIRQACSEATGSIRLEPLDKGLSGARVLLAQWPLQANTVSAPHVLKIGDLEKLRGEAACTEKLISPVDPQVGHIRLFADDTNNLGLLRQAFLGSSDGRATSLKQSLRDERYPEKAVDQIRSLYSVRMRQWNCAEGSTPPSEKRSFNEVFAGRTARQKDLGQAFDEVGRLALNDSFAALKFASLAEVEAAIPRLSAASELFSIGLTHGDLHAQNVLVSNGSLQLIDFAWAKYNWKAVDFLMMECSLKLLVVPVECRLEDLVRVETLVEAGAEFDQRMTELDHCPYANYLHVFGAALAAVRQQARSLAATVDFEQYRRGLIVLMSCLGTYPDLNRNFLAHSLAYHVSKLR